MYKTSVFTTCSWLDHTVSIGAVLIEALGLQTGWGFNGVLVNTPMWYISVLLFNYVVFYFLVYISTRLRIPVEYLFTCMVFLGIGIVNNPINRPFLYELNGRGYYSFFFGLLLAGFMQKHKISSKLEWLCAAVLLIGPLLAYFWPDLLSFSFGFLLTFVYYPSLVIVFKSRLISSILNKKAIGELGRISFDVYVWHMVVFMLLYYAMKIFDWSPNLASRRTMAGFAAACFVFGTLSYYFIEKPINRWIQSAFKD